MKIISNNNISDGIIYYQLPFQLKLINDLTYATTVKHLSHYDVLNSKLVLPDNPEQQHKIANFLDKKVAEIDHILEKTRESIEEYKKYKQSIITEAVTKGLNPDVKMKDSGIEWIGEIPEHWIYGRIKYNTYLKGRIGWQGLKADEFIDEGPYLVTGIHFGNDEVDWDKCYHISAERYNEAPEIHLRVGDLLITKDGTIGKLAYIWCLPE
jgi:type I restriction enzyme S subunit